MNVEGLKEIARLLNGLSSQDFTDLAESVLGYLKDLGLYEQFEKINREVYPEGENSMRTYNITNAFVREGMEKGILKGRVEGLEQGQAQLQREQVPQMLKDGLSIDRIRKYTKLSDDEIQAFQKNGQG